MGRDCLLDSREMCPLHIVCRSKPEDRRPFDDHGGDLTFVPILKKVECDYCQWYVNGPKTPSRSAVQKDVHKRNFEPEFKLNVLPLGRARAL